MKKILVLSGLLGIVLVTALYVGIRAQEVRRPKDMPGMERMRAAREKMQLNLTDEQKDKIHDIMSKSRKEMITARAGLKVARIELAELIAEKITPEPVIIEKQKAVLDLQNNIARSMLSARLEVRAVMSDEQWEKAGTLKRFMMFRRGLREGGPAGGPHMQRENMKFRRPMGGPGPWGTDVEGLFDEDLSIVPDFSLEPPADEFGFFQKEWDAVYAGDEEDAPVPPAHGMENQMRTAK